MRNRTLGLAALLTVLLAVGSLSPAEAADPYGAPVVSVPDTSVAGHVTGTVTSDAPYLRLEMIGATDPDAIATTTVANSGSTPFDFETWGWPKVRIRATACAAADDCAGDSTTTSVATATGAAPAVTWPEDTTIGTDNATYEIEIDDAEGAGGQLRVAFGPWTMNVPHTGLVDISPILHDWTGPIAIERCSATYPGACTSTGVSRSVKVWRTFQVRWAQAYGGATDPDDTTAADLTLSYELGVAVSSATFDYTVTPVGGGTGRSGSAVATPSSSTAHAVGIDLTGLADGQYIVTGTFTFTEPDFGTITGQVLDGTLVDVDNTAPVITSVAFDRSTVYPFYDGYQDTVGFRATGDGTDTTLSTVTYDVLDASGQVLWTQTRLASPGLGDERGTWAPGTMTPGLYVLRITVHDHVGHVTTKTSAPVTLSTKKLTWVTETRTVSAKASLVSKRVGRCSTLRSPSLHRWSGSLGLYSGTRCAPSGAAGVISTTHHYRLPAALRYNIVRVGLNGAAATAKPRSVARWRLRLPSGAWTPFFIASAANGGHYGPGTPTAGMRSGWDLVWNVNVARGNRYDLRSFTIRYDYQTLR